MKKIINRDIIIQIFTFLLTISIVFRSYPEMIYQKGYIEILIVGIFAILSLVVSSNKIRLKSIDIIWFLFPLFFLTSDNITKYMAFYVYGLIYYFVIRDNPKNIRVCKYILIGFAIFTCIVSWIAYFNSTFYINKILRLFPEYKSLTYMFLNKGMNHGFTTHYSRNGFYIAMGIIAIFSELFVNKNCRYHFIKIMILLFFLLTMFLVGKRGLTLFGTLAIITIILLKQQTLGKKIKKMIFSLILVFSFSAIAYFTIPAAHNLIQRLIINDDVDISTGRFYLFSVAWNMFLKKPILGNGWGSFLKMMYGTTYQAVHNDFLQLLAECGVIGLIIFILPNFLCLNYTIKQYKYIINSSDETLNKDKEFITFSLIFQILFLLMSLTGYPHFSYEYMTLYFMVVGATLGHKTLIGR